jgi:TRAP transporter TAXI family solute receptor
MPMQTARLVLSIAAALVAGAASAEEIRLMTGPQGGVWVPLGGQLKDMWEKAIPGLSVKTLPGAGIANVRGIEEAKTEVGFGNTISTADAILGNPPFDKKHTKVCNLATLYPQYFQVIVPADSGIASVKDAKGKGVTTQQRGNTGEQITQHILKVNGLSYSDVKVSFGSYTDSIEQVKDNRAQIFTLGTGLPAGTVMDLAASRDIKVLDLAADYPEMLKLNPAYKLVKIPANTYAKQAADVQTIGYYTHIAVACDYPADKAYTMVKTILANKDGLSALYKDLAALTPQIMAQDIGVPMHPGAAKFYAEQGVK